MCQAVASASHRIVYLSAVQGKQRILRSFPLKIRKQASSYGR